MAGGTGAGQSVVRLPAARWRKIKILQSETPLAGGSQDADVMLASPRSRPITQGGTLPTAADEVETTDGVVLVFIGRACHPARHCAEFLPSGSSLYSVEWIMPLGNALGKVPEGLRKLAGGKTARRSPPPVPSARGLRPERTLERDVRGPSAAPPGRIPKGTPFRGRR